jgi:hypothetical protein
MSNGFILSTVYVNDPLQPEEVEPLLTVTEKHTESTQPAKLSSMSKQAVYVPFVAYV